MKKQSQWDKPRTREQCQEGFILLLLTGQRNQEITSKSNDLSTGILILQQNIPLAINKFSPQISRVRQKFSFPTCISNSVLFPTNLCNLPLKPSFSNIRDRVSQVNVNTWKTICFAFSEPATCQLEKFLLILQEAVSNQTAFSSSITLTPLTSFPSPYSSTWMSPTPPCYDTHVPSITVQFYDFFQLCFSTSSFPPLGNRHRHYPKVKEHYGCSQIHILKHTLCSILFLKTATIVFASWPLLKIKLPFLTESL